MKAAEIIKRIEDLGGYFVRQKGSHARYAAKFTTADGKESTCFTTVQQHGNRDIPAGTVAAIRRDMTPAFGEGWL